MYAVRMPDLLRTMFPGLVWHITGQKNTIFLTFDDGPVPGVTDFVLDTLYQYGAKATFFCIGKNVVSHPEVFDRIIDHGHSVGNHTYRHLNGWRTDDEVYFDDVVHCSEVIKGSLFRPPYGRLSLSQMHYLKKNYTVVMWDVLSGDFNVKLHGRDCLRNVVNHATGGSIVVMHDSIKAEPRLRFALPKMLEFFSKKGYTFAQLPELISR